MARLLSALLLMSAAGLATVPMWASLVDDDFDYSAIYAERERLEEIWRGRKSFVEVRDRVMTALGRGQVNLRQACAEVRAAAAVFYPTYMDILAQAFPEQTADERLAHNLLGHLGYWIQDNMVPPNVLPALEKELEGWRAE